MFHNQLFSTSVARLRPGDSHTQNGGLEQLLESDLPGGEQKLQVLTSLQLVVTEVGSPSKMGKVELRGLPVSVSGAFEVRCFSVDMGFWDCWCPLISIDFWLVAVIFRPPQELAPFGEIMRLELLTASQWGCEWSPVTSSDVDPVIASNEAQPSRGGGLLSMFWQNLD